MIDIERIQAIIMDLPIVQDGKTKITVVEGGLGSYQCSYGLILEDLDTGLKHVYTVEATLQDDDYRE